MSNIELGISTAEAVELMNFTDSQVLSLITRAEKTRQKYRGNEVVTCSIVNAKSGNCSENCTFCPQSLNSASDIDTYDLKKTDEIIEKAQSAADKYAHSFGIVTSGRLVESQEDKEVILESVKGIAEGTSASSCGSFGIIEKEFLQELKDNGLTGLHHNLETARSYYHNICTTRTYDDNIRTIKAAKEVGLSICSGGIFGMGETNEQRVEFIEQIRELDVDSFPVNFFNPIEGTPLGDSDLEDLTPLECLKIIAISRLMMPKTQIRICGGRERNMREMQSWMFAAGADALMIGSYLTTNGRDVEADMQMIKDAGLTLAKNGSCGSGGCGSGDCEND